MTPRLVHIADQVLAALASDGSMTTSQVAEAIGMPIASPEPWRALDRLAKTGQVKRVRTPDTLLHWATVVVPLPLNLMLHRIDKESIPHG
jgi:hypothetical protein